MKLTTAVSAKQFQESEIADGQSPVSECEVSAGRAGLKFGSNIISKLKYKKNPKQIALKGFTLSEVLITLVIIGIIAAISIPAISAATRRHETSARLKKFYAALNDACIKAKAFGNDWEVWADSASGDREFGETATTADAFAQQYLLPYFNYMKTEVNGYLVYVYLTDGSYFWTKKGQCIDFTIDINGKKKPNVWAKDIFMFIYCPYSVKNFVSSGKVIPFQPIGITNREQALNSCKIDASTCTPLIMMDGWEFKDDYPYSI